MKEIYSRLVLTLVIVAASATDSYADPEIVTRTGILPSNYDYHSPCIAIGAYQDTLVKAIWTHYTPGWVFYPYFGTRNSDGIWSSNHLPVDRFEDAELYLGNDGRAFINTGNLELVIEDNDDFIVRNIEPNTVMDSVGSFHHIQGYNGVFNYWFSDDTLQSYSYTDTLFIAYDFLSIEASADRGLVCAVFSDGDSLIKFIGAAGVPLNFDSFSVFPNAGGYTNLAIDKSGKIYIPFIGPPVGEYWASVHVWSEDFGDVFVCPAGDVAQEGWQLQACFAGCADTVFVLASIDFNDESFILFSTDGGAIWNYSDLAPLSKTATTPTLSGDYLHVISESDWERRIYYEAFSVVAVLNNYTFINESTVRIPHSLSLSNYPNPFNASTTISFSLPEAGEVRLAVYDIRGRLVNTLVNEKLDAGTYTVLWDGLENSGQTVSSGVYFYKLSSEGYTETKRMLLLK